jgi:hypothetical protein
MSDVSALNFTRSRGQITEENAFLTKSEVIKVILCITLKFVGSGKVGFPNACLRQKKSELFPY